MRYSLLVLAAILLTPLPATAQQTKPQRFGLIQDEPQLALAEETSASPVVAGTLASLVAELERNNPELQAARREVDMRVARIAPAGTPPDPTLNVGYMGGLLRPFFPSATTPQAFQQFGASQEIPYPGKLTLRSRIAATDADAERWNYEDVHRRLVAELKTAYVEYGYLDRAIAIIQRNKQRLEEFRKIAEARFTVGKGIQQDVLKAQLEISLLLERLANFERQRGVLEAQINSLLYRRPDTPLPVDVTFQAADVTMRRDELRALAQRNYPALRRDEQVINRGQQTLALAKKEVLPDFAVTFNSQRFTSEMPWMYGIDVMVTVPLYWQRKQRPMIAEAAAALESGRRMRDNTQAQATARVIEEHLAATTSKRLVDLYSDSILPQARLALESSLAAYQVGTVDFLTMLTNFITVLNYEVSYEEQGARYHQALARLEPLVGLELIR